MSAELEQVADLVAERVADLVAARLVRPFVRVGEAAEALGVPQKWLAAAARNGEAPCRRVGQYVLFDVVEVRAWIDATTASGPGAGTGPVAPSAVAQRLSAVASEPASGVPLVVPRRAA